MRSRHAALMTGLVLTLALRAWADAPGVTTTGAGQVWEVLAPNSQVTLIGSTRGVQAQNRALAAAIPPADWRTLDALVFPSIDLAFNEFVDLMQAGQASGISNSANGLMTLELPLQLIDSGGDEVTLAVHLTTEQTNGTDPDGMMVCLGLVSDPSVCRGTRRDPVTGTFRLVAITQIPADSDTIVDRELLLIELDGRIAPRDTDGDLLEDFIDNCPATVNAGQGDIDLDALGDVCDACTDRDADGHGFPGDVSCPEGSVGDCDDTRASVHPNGLEICDSLDNDCDVQADEAVCEDFDVNVDAAVDGVELAWVGRAFGLCSATPAQEWWFEADYDRDGCVDGADLAFLASIWGCIQGPICE